MNKEVERKAHELFLSAKAEGVDIFMVIGAGPDVDNAEYTSVPLVGTHGIMRATGLCTNVLVKLHEIIGDDLYNGEKIKGIVDRTRQEHIELDTSKGDE